MSRRSSQSRLIGRISLALLTVALLTLLGFVHFKWWPWLMHQPVLGVSDLQGSNQLRTYLTITDDGILSVYGLHAQTMIQVGEKRKTLSNAELNLENLVLLPGVFDAFYISFEKQNAISTNKLIPDQILIERLDMRNKPAGGAAQISRRLVGGLTRFRRIKLDNIEYPVMIHYLDTFYPSYATDAIGLVLNEKWLIDQIPSRLDSLMRNNTNMLFFAPAPPDTAWGQQEDLYACPGGTWKQTVGVLYAGDTLWWYGNREPSEKDKSYAMKQPLQGFDVSIFVRVNFPEYAEDVSEGRKYVNVIFILLEIFGFLIILVLFLSIAMTNKQASRNQIALAHLAHAVKTPVARIRLSTDSLQKEMVTSPKEEREVIDEIATECDRLETAVRGAAYSLEGIGKRLSLEKVELSDELSENVERWKVQYSKSGVVLQFEKAVEPVSVQLDRNLFSVTVDNLLDNALRHTLLNKKRKNLENARVIVSIHTEGKYSVMTIDDCGGGIPKSERKRLFKRFQRVADDAATGVSGLGLGLALVKEIAQAHNGDVSVEDNDSGGSRFKVRLPLSG